MGHGGACPPFPSLVGRSVSLERRSDPLSLGRDSTFWRAASKFQVLTLNVKYRSLSLEDGVCESLRSPVASSAVPSRFPHLYKAAFTQFPGTSVLLSVIFRAGNIKIDVTVLVIKRRLTHMYRGVTGP